MAPAGPPLQCLTVPHVWPGLLPQWGPPPEELVLTFFKMITNILEACHQKYRRVTVTSLRPSLQGPMCRSLSESPARPWSHTVSGCSFDLRPPSGDVQGGRLWGPPSPWPAHLPTRRAGCPGARHSLTLKHRSPRPRSADGSPAGPRPALEPAPGRGPCGDLGRGNRPCLGSNRSRSGPPGAPSSTAHLARSRPAGLPGASRDTADQVQDESTMLPAQEQGTRVSPEPSAHLRSRAAWR